MRLQFLNSGEPKVISSFFEGFGDIKRQYKRRGTNKKHIVDMMLEFLTGEYRVYDRVVFLCDNDIDRGLLKKRGFLIEHNKLSFEHSECSAYWERWKIEIEIVPPTEWENLKKCLEMAELTGFYNINKIYNIVTK